MWDLKNQENFKYLNWPGSDNGIPILNPTFDSSSFLNLFDYSIEETNNLVNEATIIEIRENCSDSTIS